MSVSKADPNASLKKLLIYARHVTSVYCLKLMFKEVFQLSPTSLKTKLRNMGPNLYSRLALPSGPIIQ